MATCAVVNLSSNLVENLIVSSPDDPVDYGYVLIASPPPWVQIGTAWDGDFVKPVVEGAASVKGVETL